MKPRDEILTAIIMGDLDTVKRIFPQHPEALSWTSPADYPLLHMAILNERANIAEYLVEHGADLKQKAVGATAEHHADRKGMLELLRAAAGRQEAIRRAAIDSCGDEMRKGLENPVAIAKRPLTLKRPGLS
ncbi:MAG: ankyrin repeat domain-containing protein [Alphaproteobacteria bacterium]